MLYIYLPINYTRCTFIIWKELLTQIFHNENSINLSQGNPFLLPSSATFEHLAAVDVVTAPPLSGAVTTAIAAFFGQRKKFLEPNAISFSSLSKPVTRFTINNSIGFSYWWIGV